MLFRSFLTSCLSLSFLLYRLFFVRQIGYGGKIAINDEKLECQVGHIVLELADVMKNPDYHSPTLEIWCDYFLKMNIPKAESKLEPDP